MKIKICHLYGNLLNTYGDVGNIMALRYLAENEGYQVDIDIVSLEDNFDPDKYNFVFFGGGQDFEQEIIHQDLLKKGKNISKYIENDRVFLSVCGGYQLLGEYYYNGRGKKIDGLSLFHHYTLGQKDGERFVGDIKIKSTLTGDTYLGFENHGGRTFLGNGQIPFGKVLQGHGNNGEDGSEGFRYKNTFGTYLHGPILAKNMNLARRILKIIKG